MEIKSFIAPKTDFQMFNEFELDYNRNNSPSMHEANILYDNNDDENVDEYWEANRQNSFSKYRDSAPNEMDLQELNSVILNRYRHKAPQWIRDERFAFHRMKYPEETAHILDLDDDEIDKTQESFAYKGPSTGESKFIEGIYDIDEAIAKSNYSDAEYQRIKKFFNSQPNGLPHRKNIYNERFKYAISEHSNLLAIENDRTRLADHSKSRKRVKSVDLMESANRLSRVPNRNHDYSRFKTIHDEFYLNDSEIEKISLRLYNARRRPTSFFLFFIFASSFN
jgi:hypothetical protein